MAQAQVQHVAKSGSKLDFIEQFTFYGQYHANKVNVAIHVVCVPTIFFTALVLVHGFGAPMLASIKLPDVLASFAGKSVDLTPSMLTAIAYACYFILLEPVAGILYAPFLLSMGHVSNVWYATAPNDSMRTAGVLFVASWIAQFIGHGKFEGRAPALFDSLVQSLVLAVFFVFLEVLFALGYRPELHRELQNSIGKAILEYRRGKKAS